MSSFHVGLEPPEIPKAADGSPADGSQCVTSEPLLLYHPN